MPAAADPPCCPADRRRTSAGGADRPTTTMQFPDASALTSTESGSIGESALLPQEQAAPE